MAAWEMLPFGHMPAACDDVCERFLRMRTRMATMER
jgi:hypothetical protein